MLSSEDHTNTMYRHHRPARRSHPNGAPRRKPPKTRKPRECGVFESLPAKHHKVKWLRRRRPDCARRIRLCLWLDRGRQPKKRKPRVCEAFRLGMVVTPARFLALRAPRVQGTFCGEGVSVPAVRDRLAAKSNAAIAVRLALPLARPGQAAEKKESPAFARLSDWVWL